MSNRYMLLKAGHDTVTVLTIENGGFAEFNKAINADWGTIVRVPALDEVIRCKGVIDKRIELWVDDEALLKPERPALNRMASMFAEQVIFGDAVMLMSDENSGDSGGLPLPYLVWVHNIIADMAQKTEMLDFHVGQMLKHHDEWMKETGGTGIKVTAVEQEDDR